MTRKANIEMMKYRALAMAIWAGGCGSVAGPEPTDAAVGDAPVSGTPTTYKGKLPETSPVTFGGGRFCTYTMTLKQIDAELVVQPSGQVTSGRVQNLNVEATVPPCTVGVIPPNIATYTLESAKPGTSGTTLTFVGAAANEPTVVLSGTLTGTGAALSVALSFHRIGTTDPVLEWTVATTVTVAAQP